MLNAQVIKAIERFAPPSLQESYDNTGLQVGTLNTECTGVLICFDVTPAVIEEAISLNYNLVISHHPLFFRGVKRLTGDTPQQVCAINAIAAGITIYSSHTAIDSTVGGVSYALAQLLDVTPVRVLGPLADRLVKLQVYVPESHADVLRAALYDAGAGEIGDYDCCSFNVSGYGTFRANEGADPYVGNIGEIHEEKEVEISMMLTADKMRKVESVLLEVHPYETPAYQFIPTFNKLSNVGLGIYGTLDEALSPIDFIDKLKAALGVSVVRTTSLPVDPEYKIRRVAMCGGAGHEFIDTAIAMGAQVYITADLKYHDFIDYQGRIILIDAGHYETEAAVKRVMLDVISKACPEFDAVKCSTMDTNPVNYL